jgi:hypothetical protein
MRFCGLIRPVALVQSPSRLYLSSVNYRGPKAPKKWVEVKKAKKRARKLLDRKDRGSKALVLPPEISPKSLSSAMGIRTLDILKLMIRLGGNNKKKKRKKEKKKRKPNIFLQHRAPLVGRTAHQHGTGGVDLQRAVF